MAAATMRIGGLRSVIGHNRPPRAIIGAKGSSKTDGVAIQLRLKSLTKRPGRKLASRKLAGCNLSRFYLKYGPPHAQL